MDLPTCPACGQSVLDDDAEDCPFCGASMSGKPGAAAPKPPAGAGSAQQKPSSAKPAAPSGKGPTPAKGEDADPFAVEKRDSGKVVRLHTEPTKGRSHKVVCPMCDTLGYTGTKAAGHEVRCPNPECALPVFTAPKLEKKEEPVEEEPKKGLSPGVLIAGVGGIVLLGGIAWFFLMGDQSTTSLPEFDEVTEGGGLPDGDDSDTGTDETGDSKAEKATKVVVVQFDAIKVRPQVLEMMVDYSEQAKSARKPLGVRMTSQTFAELDDAEGTRKQLQRLNTVGQSVPHYKIPALARLAWKEIRAGNKDAAVALLAEAEAAAGAMGQVGRTPIDMATILAAPLVAVGRDAQARDLIEKYGNAEALGQLSATLLMMQQQSGYDLDRFFAEQAVSASRAPQWVAVTSGLARQKQWDQGLAWAGSHADVEGRTESVVLWAELLTVDALENKQTEGLSGRLQAAAEKLSPVGQARLWSRVAERQFRGNDKAGGEQSLTTARELLGSIVEPKPFVLAPPAELYRLGQPGRDDLGLPEAVPLRMAALAAAELAGAELSGGHTKEAWSSIQRAMGYARGMAPSMSAIGERLDANSNKANVVQSAMRKTLNLETANRVRLAFSRYTRHCATYLEAAEERQEIQVAILSRAARRGLEQEVWKEIQLRSAGMDLNQRQEYHSTAVSVILVYRFIDTKSEALLKEVQKIFTEGGARPDAAEDLFQRSARTITASPDSSVQAARLLEDKRIDPVRRELWTMQLASRLGQAKNVDAAVRFAEAGKDPILRENVLNLIATIATANGAGETIWTLLQDGTRTTMNKVALCRGFVAGTLEW